MQPSVLQSLLADRQLLVSGLVMVASIVMLYVTREWDPLTPAVVSDATQIELTAPADGATDIGPAFRWQPVPGAAAYRLDVFAPDLATAIRRRVTDTTATPTPEEAAALRPGATFYWRVEALDADGRPMASSARRTFRPVEDQ